MLSNLIGIEYAQLTSYKHRINKILHNIFSSSMMRNLNTTIDCIDCTAFVQHTNASKAVLLWFKIRFDSMADRSRSPTLLRLPCSKESERYLIVSWLHRDLSTCINQRFIVAQRWNDISRLRGLLLHVSRGLIIATAIVGAEKRNY